MNISVVRNALFSLAAVAFMPPIHAQEQAPQEDDGLTEVFASHSLTVMRGTDKAIKSKGIHPKKIERKEKHSLARIAMIRFHHADLGKRVRLAGL
ncbi:MAG: hypothetical protein AB8C95_06610, partial [Phycisphaeraceae bacterium]